MQKIEANDLRAGVSVIDNQSNVECRHVAILR